MTCQIRTVRCAELWGRHRLLPSPSASLDSALLLAFVLGTSRVWTMTHPEAELTPGQVVKFERVIQRRATGEPVAYIRGIVEWYGLQLKVTRDVLVPRPETELLLEEVHVLAREREIRNITDVGTGSGAIAVGLAVSLPSVSVAATDICPRALAVAEENCANIGVADRVALALGDLVAPLHSPPDLVVANLPYLSDGMMDQLDRDVRHEPELALRAGATGLELYDRLMTQLDERGWYVPVIIEIDPRQGPMLEGRYPNREVTIRRDYAGHQRIAVVREPER